MTSQESMFEQLKSEFPGYCVHESPTGRFTRGEVRWCGLKEKPAGSGTCRFHQGSLGGMSRAEQELQLVLAQFQVSSTVREELAVALIDTGWRRLDLQETDYDRTA